MREPNLDKMQELKLLQAQNLNLAKEIFKVTDAIDKLPKGGIRPKLETRHDQLMERSSRLDGEILERDVQACVFGMRDKCTQASCLDCL